MIVNYVENILTKLSQNCDLLLHHRIRCALFENTNCKIVINFISIYFFQKDSKLKSIIIFEISHCPHPKVNFFLFLLIDLPKNKKTFVLEYLNVMKTIWKKNLISSINFIVNKNSDNIIENNFIWLLFIWKSSWNVKTIQIFCFVLNKIREVIVFYL